MSKKVEQETVGQELAFAAGIEDRIYTIRGVQVMLDSDLAGLYNVETKVLNQAVKRNRQRFPDEFCFQLTGDEFQILKSQIVTSSWGGRRTRPYAFTEQGVSMLSAVLKSVVAIDVCIKIIKAFVAMRRFLLSNALVFQRLDTLEIKQLETDRRMDTVLNAIESRDIQPKQGIFFEGQVFDAYRFVSDLFRTAKESIVIIDNYLDDSVLTHLTKRKKDVRVHLLTRNLSEILVLDVSKFNKQYPEIEIKQFDNSHDRFIIIDNSTVYHFGASVNYQPLNGVHILNHC